MQKLQELDDRWILPLRYSRVTSVGVAEVLRITLEPPATIKVGDGALISAGPLTSPGARPWIVGDDPHRLQELTTKRVLSGVGGKSGSLRVVFDNGWHLNVKASSDVMATVRITTPSIEWTKTSDGGVVEVDHG